MGEKLSVKSQIISKCGGILALSTYYTSDNKYGKFFKIWFKLYSMHLPYEYQAVIYIIYFLTSSTVLQIILKL